MTHQPLSIQHTLASLYKMVMEPVNVNDSATDDTYIDLFRTVFSLTDDNDEKAEQLVIHAVIEVDYVQSSLALTMSVKHYLPAYGQLDDCSMQIQVTPSTRIFAPTLYGDDGQYMPMSLFSTEFMEPSLMLHLLTSELPVAKEYQSRKVRNSDDAWICSFGLWAMVEKTMHEIQNKIGVRFETVVSRPDDFFYGILHRAVYTMAAD